MLKVHYAVSFCKGSEDNQIHVLFRDRTILVRGNFGNVLRVSSTLGDENKRFHDRCLGWKLALLQTTSKRVQVCDLDIDLLEVLEQGRSVGRYKIIFTTEKINVNF